MDKFIYRGMIVLACVILSIVLILAPVMVRMYIDIRAVEAKVDAKLKQLDKEGRKHE